MKLKQYITYQRPRFGSPERSLPSFSIYIQLRKGRWIWIIPKIIYDLLGISILWQLVRFDGTGWARTTEYAQLEHKTCH